MLTTTSQPLPIHPHTDARVDHGQDLIPNQISRAEPPSSPPSDPSLQPSLLDPPTPSGPPDQKKRPPPLLILDLNGCLVHRQFSSGLKTIIPRPHLNQLFDYIFHRPHPPPNSLDDDHPHQSIDSPPNWEVVIWSSAQPQNVERMLEAIHLSKRPPPSKSIGSQPLRRPATKDLNNQLNDISNRLNSLDIGHNTPTSARKSVPPPRQVLDVWDRSMMDLSSQDYNRKVQTTKDLSKLWAKLKWTDPKSAQSIPWGPHNTVIVDDSPDKLSLQPDNLCTIEEFTGSKDDRALIDLIEKLKSIRDHTNIPEALQNLNSTKQPNGDQSKDQSKEQTSSPGKKEPTEPTPKEQKKTHTQRE